MKLIWFITEGSLWVGPLFCEDARISICGKQFPLLQLSGMLPKFLFLGDSQNPRNTLDYCKEGGNWEITVC